MKTTPILLIITIAFASSLFADSPEERLATLQIQEFTLKEKYKSANPKLQEVQARIESLEKVPNIQNDKYFEFFSKRLIQLKAQREVLSKKFKSTNPLLVELDAQISFAQATLTKGQANKTLQLTPSR